jgi:transposase
MKTSYKTSREEAKEIREKMKAEKDKNVYRRMEAVALLGEGKTPIEVSDITKYNEKYVRILGCYFHKKGLEEFAIEGRKGGNHRLMDFKESEEFLNQFKEKAEKGQIVTIEEIAAAFDKKTGKQRKSLSTVYYFMHSHGWRKIMPRSEHPNKASDEAIEASKKLTLES